MNRTIAVAGIATVIFVSGCGGGVEHESRTRIHVHSLGEQQPSSRSIGYDPVFLHTYASEKCVLIKLTTD